MLLELKNLFLEDGGKKDLHYEMDLSQIVFSGVRPFITPVSVTAQRIVEYRSAHGFARIEDLMNVKGIGQAKFKKMQHWLDL